MALDYNLISAAAFYIIVAILIYINRKNITVQNKVIFLYKTGRFNKLMERIAAISPRFWRLFGIAAVPVGFGAMLFIFGYLLYKLLQLFFAPAAAPSLSLVIPGVHIPGAAVFVPFWYGIIALFVVILVHEGAHGIVLAANKLKIKSSGVGIALFLPLAFVEPDEKQLMKQKASTQIGVYGAGALSNFVTALIILGLTTFLIAPAVSNAIVPSGLLLESIAENSPAALAGLANGQIITGINNTNTKTTEDFVNYMQTIKPGQTVSIKTQDKTFSILTNENPEKKEQAYLGIQFSQKLDVREGLKQKFGNLPFTLLYLLRLFYWIFALNIGIGAINLLPLGPIDGGRMANTLLQSIFEKKRAMKAFAAISYLSLFLLLANLIFPYISKAFA